MAALGKYVILLGRDLGNANVVTNIESYMNAFLIDLQYVIFEVFSRTAFI